MASAIVGRSTHQPRRVHLLDSIPSQRRWTTRSFICHAEKESIVATTPVKLFMSAAAATAIFATAPVDAKQILVQPKLKSIFYEADTEKKKEGPSSNRKASSMSSVESGFPLNLGVLSIPLTILGCAGLYVAGASSGDGFDSFLSSASCKDSVSNGVGYEEECNKTYN